MNDTSAKAIKTYGYKFYDAKENPEYEIILKCFLEETAEENIAATERIVMSYPNGKLAKIEYEDFNDELTSHRVTSSTKEGLLDYSFSFIFPCHPITRTTLSSLRHRSAR